MTPKKRVHWTHTPEGKAKLAQRAASRVEGPINGTPIKDTPIFAYALGHIEAWIETYAKSAGVPYEALAPELGKILQVKARR